MTPNAPIHQATGFRLNFLNRLNLTRKFLLLIVLLLLPLSAMFAQLITKANQTISTNETELAGIETMIPLRNLAQHMAEHRGITHAVHEGNTQLSRQLEEKRKLVAADFGALDRLSAQPDNPLVSSDQFSDIKEGWTKLLLRLEKLTDSEAIHQHTQLIAQVLGLINHVSDTANLAIDPDLSNAYLIDLMTDKIPHLTETAGILRAKSSGAAAKGRIGGIARTEVYYLVQKVLELAHGVENAGNIIGEHDRTLKQALAAQGNQVVASAMDFARHVEKRILEPSEIKADSTKMFAEGTHVILIANQLFDLAAEHLELRIKMRIEEEKKSALFELFILISFVTLSLIMALAIVRSITRPLHQAVRIFGDIGRGNYNNHIEINGNDEVSQVQFGLKQMQETLQSDRLQREKQQFEMERIKSALEYIDTPVTVSNEDGELLFMNRSGQTLFNEFQQQKLTGEPDFDPASLLGTRIADFFEGDELQQIFQASQEQSQEASFATSGREFRLNINPIYNSAGKYQGRITQWIEETEQKAVEKEIQSVVDAAQDGDLSQRVALENKHGFFLAFSSSVNHLLEINARFTDELGQVLLAVALGDLSKTVNGEYCGQFSTLKDNTNETITRLRRVIAELQHSADEIAQGVQEISNNNQELNNRTEEQASSLEQTASAMEEITSMVRNTAESVTLANELAHTSRELGHQGDQVLAQAITSMEEIDQASHKIEKIIVVINEIAFQTNLLALNASVEAAHAGDQGKGFAVVATEVRNLAQRSAQAATEIKTLIEDSGLKVQQGSNLVADSGQALGEIVTSVNKVGDLLAEIENAGNEQSKGIGEVNQAITRIDSATQSNTAMVNQTAAASRELEKHAIKLAQLVEFFDVGDAPLPSTDSAEMTERRGDDVSERQADDEIVTPEEEAWVA